MSPLQPVSTKGSASARRTQVIIDTDPGLGFPWADVDDNLAVLLALASEGLDVRLISIVEGNTRCSEGVASISETLAMIGRRVAIAEGAPGGSPPGRRSSTRRSGDAPGRGAFISGRERMAESLAGRIQLPPVALGTAAADAASRPPREALPDALSAQVDLLESAAGTVTLLCLGPLTNIARLLAERPDLARRIERLVIMGGAIDHPGNVTPAAEFNIWADPQAASIVFAAPVPRVLVPLDVTMTVTLLQREIEAALPGSGAYERYLVEGVAAWTAIWEQLNGSASFVPHDPLAAAYLVEPALFTAEAMRVSVEPKNGRTMGSRTREGDTLVCTGVDRSRFKELFLSAIARFGSKSAEAAGAGSESTDRGPSLALFQGERLLFVSHGRWLHPLFELEGFLADSGGGVDPRGLLVRDRIVGKAAALLITRLGLRRVHARTLSRLGEQVLVSRGVDFTYETLVERIDCATEELLLRIDDEESAYRLIAERAARTASPRR